MNPTRLLTLFVLIGLAASFSRSAWALVQLKAEIETDSQKLSPSVITPEGTWTEVETDTLLVRLRVTPDENQAHIDAEISINEDGKQKLLGKPSLRVRWDDSAEVSASTDDGSLIYRLRVIPTQMADRAVAGVPSPTAQPSPASNANPDTKKEL